MVQGKKSKNELLKRLKKFEKGWAGKRADFRIDFQQVKRQIIEYFEKTGNYALRYGKLTKDFKEWLYQNSKRFTIHSPP